MVRDVVTLTPKGLYCPAGDFYIDPWKPVERALITHAHADHARPGSSHYHAAKSGVGLLKKRLGQDTAIQAHAYGTRVPLGDAVASFHPAGHVLGSAQVRIEVDGEVWVISGDYKCDEDPSCETFEPVPCDVFVTEATFALPIYRWDPIEQVMRELMRWWQANAEAGRASVVFCYALGKAQRLLAEIARHRQAADRVIYLHGAVDALMPAYREAGIALPETATVLDQPKDKSFAGELVIAPPSAFGSPWMQRLGDCGTAFASGWMRVRGHRRRRGFDEGFVLSDHADWPGLLQTIEATGAKKVYATHGYSDTLARYLKESKNIDAEPLATLFEGEGDDT
ncbi:MAG: ligase-associated DNA damage response exonuclease [Alphaproteobacteria bacterium]